MNTRANNDMFNVDIDKVIEMVSNWDKCWQLQSEIDYDKCCHKEHCDECDYMYGSGCCGEISNCLENIIEWLEELKEYRQNIANERTKTIDEVIKTLAKSEDTILTDSQYYTLIELKEGAEK